MACWRSPMAVCGSPMDAGYGNEICLLRNRNGKCYGKADGVASLPDRHRSGTTKALFGQTPGLESYASTVRGGNTSARTGTSRKTCQAKLQQYCLWIALELFGPASTAQSSILKQGSRRFEPTGAFAAYSTAIAQAPDGTIWLADSGSYVRAIGMSVSVKSAATAQCEAIWPADSGSYVRSETPPTDTAKECPDEDPLEVRLRGRANKLFL